MKKIIVVTGPDGSGKSTLINRLVSEMSTRFGKTAQEVSIWDALKKEPVRSKFPLSPSGLDEYLSVMSTRARSLFLAHALMQALDMAIADPSSEVLFVNAYWTKYFACEMAYGASEQWLLNLAAAFPKPDLIIYLDIDVKTAVSRKERVSGYESGFAEPSIRKSAFETFQAKVHPVLLDWQRRLGWHFIAQTQDPSEAFQKAQEVLRDFFA